MATISGIDSNSINSISGLNVQAITHVSGQSAAIFFSAGSLLPGRLWAYYDPAAGTAHPFNSGIDACALWTSGNSITIANSVYFDPVTGRVYDDPAGLSQHYPITADAGYYLFQSSASTQQFATYFEKMISSWAGTFTVCA